MVMATGRKTRPESFLAIHASDRRGFVLLGTSIISCISDIAYKHLIYLAFHVKGCNTPTSLTATDYFSANSNYGGQVSKR
jgi:hypothetical protein